MKYEAFSYRVMRNVIARPPFERRLRFVQRRIP